MALDSADRRGSAISLALSFLVVLPTPDGLALDGGDREQVTHCYRGLDATATPPTVDAHGLVIAVAATDRTVHVPAR